MSLDHTQDLTGSEQHRLIQLYPTPDFVKQASHEQLCGDPATLPPHVYAGVSKRVYPCHTKAATWMSALFYGDKSTEFSAHEAEEIKKRLLKSAEFHGIGSNVRVLWSKMAADAATGQLKLKDSDFALVWDTGTHKERHYPLRNAGEVKQASHWFGEHHRDFSFNDKHTIAYKIMTKAAEFGAATENTELIEKCAGMGYCSAADAAAAWERRASLTTTKHPDYSAEASRMATVIKSATFEARDQGRRIKMAGLMEQFDHLTGLNKLYDDGGLARPEDVFFQITEKVAADFLSNHVQTTTGAVYEKLALDRLDIATVRQWMGDDVADEVGGVMLDTQKLAAIVPTLPRPDAEMFEQMARTVGISAIAREKSAAAQGLTRDEMEALAAEYGHEQSLNVAEPALI